MNDLNALVEGMRQEVQKLLPDHDIYIEIPKTYRDTFYVEIAYDGHNIGSIIMHEFGCYVCGPIDDTVDKGRPILYNMKYYDPNEFNPQNIIDIIFKYYSSLKYYE